MRFIKPISRAALFLLLPLLATAQPPPQPIVRQIEVQYAGPTTVSRERILANMKTAVGKPYSEQTIEEDIRNLYAMGNITNVRIFGEPLANGVKVVVVVQTKATVGEVVTSGITRLKEGAVRKQLTVKTGETLNEANLESDRQKILEEYRKRGFTDTTVEYKTEFNEQTGKTRVVYNVTEGAKTVIHAIRFEGNATFKSKELMKVIKTRPKNMLSFLTKAGRLENDQIDADLVALREFYQDHGYIDVEIGQPRMDRIGGGAQVDLTIPIKEGEQYHVGKVAITGAQLFTADDVRKHVKTAEGAVFSPKTLRADVKAIQDMYGQRGYIDLQANGETSSGGPHLVNVAFKLDEGAQSYIDRINIQGNTRTKDKVIRRELAVAPGDVYDTVRIEGSKARLNNLNYFSRVETFPSDTAVPGHKEMNVVVEEKRTGSFNFGAGFSSIDSLLGFAEVQQSNFDITNWHGFTGGGERFRARAQYGTKRKDFIVSLTEPWFLDYQLAVGGELFYREASFVSSLYDQRDYGFDINVRKPIGNFTSVRLDYRLEDIGIFNISNDASDTIKAEEGSKVKSSVTGGITYDTRDSVFLTRHGHRIDVSAYVAGGPLGGSESIYGFDVEGSQYFHLPWDMIFLVNAAVATVDTWQNGDRVPIWDRLFLGGANDLRGFSYRKASPKDENGEPIGGKSLARVTTELTFPVIERVRGAVFYDYGFVNTSAYDFGPHTPFADVGLGVRLDLPIGPVRLDYGFPIQNDQFTHGGKFNFTIGYQF
jgi:outer membrane protein insertion porin family